jgi:hypothetical protein
LLASALVGLHINDARGDQLRAVLYARTRRVLDHLDKLGAATLNTSGFPDRGGAAGRPRPAATGRPLPTGPRRLRHARLLPRGARQEIGFRLQLTAANTNEEVTELLAVLDLLADTIPLRPRHP